MTKEQLEFMLGGHTWSDFEKTTDGNITIYTRMVDKPFPHLVVDPIGVTYSMRLGTHMGRSMMAIMAEGYFLRMKAMSAVDPVQLKKLDPEKPDTCIYNRNPSQIPSWAPQTVDPAVELKKAEMRAQLQLKQYEIEQRKMQREDADKIQHDMDAMQRAMDDRNRRLSHPKRSEPPSIHDTYKDWLNKL